MSWQIQSKDWLADYVRAIIADELAELPPREQKFGASTVRWWEGKPGDAVIMAEGGSCDDRSYAEFLCGVQLAQHGYKRAQFTIEAVGGDVLDERGRPIGQDEQQPIPVRLHYSDEIDEGEVLGFRRMQQGSWEVRIHITAITPKFGPEAGQRFPVDQVTNILQKNIDEGDPRVEVLGDNTPGQMGGPKPELPTSFSSLMQRTASGWPDIMAKAKRLIQSGQVTILRNGYNNIVAHVIGDHGEYNSEIGRDDPNSQAISTWQCECPWDQYAWARTRQWKKYEGRPCAHVLAAYWKAKSTPLDDYDPEQHGPMPGQKLSPTDQRPVSPPSGKIPEPPQGPDLAGPPAPPGAPKIPGAPPTPGPPPDATGGPLQAPLSPPGAPGVLPPSPMEQLQMQQPPAPGMTPAGLPAPPGSVSVPGAKMPSPFNPVQMPGGTYSGIFDRFRNPVKQVNKAMQDWDWGTWNPDKCQHCDQPTAYHWRHPGTWYDRYLCAQHSAEAEHYRDTFPGARPEENEYTVSPYESDGQGERPHTWEYGNGTFSHTAAQQFYPQQAVYLKNNVWGQAEGKSEAHGAGQYVEVQAQKADGSPQKAEVLGQDPTTGWIEIIVSNDEGKQLEPFLTRCFVEPADIAPARSNDTGFIRRH